MGQLSEEIFDEAKSRLRRIEAAYGVRILYACEAGSRSWGFPSPDSDYDVRFIYVSPYRSYLKLTAPKDVINEPQDGVWDITGWDLRKALVLLRKGNASLVQWLYSPIVYRNHPLFLTEIRRLLDHGSPLPKLYWAYRSMAQAHVNAYLLGHETVLYKRFLYIVQALLAMRWVETRGTIPPVVFEELVESLITDESLRAEIETLLTLKQAAGEGEKGPKQLFPGVLSLIESTLTQTQPPVGAEPEIPEDILDSFFIKWLGLPT